MPSWPTLEDMAANAQFNFAGSLLRAAPNCLPYQALTCLCYNMHLPKARGSRYPTPRVALSSLGRQLFKIPSPQEALKTLRTSPRLPYRSYSPTCCYPVPGWSSLDVFSTVEPSVTEFCLPALWVSLCYVPPVKDNLNLTPQLHPDEKADSGHWGNPDIGKNRKGTPISTLLERWPWEGWSCMGAQISVDRLLLVQTPPEAERGEDCLGFSLLPSSRRLPALSIGWTPRNQLTRSVGDRLSCLPRQQVVLCVHSSIIHKKMGTQPKCPDEWINTMWDTYRYRYIMEYYSALKSQEIVSHATVQADLENLTLSKTGQSQKDKFCLLPPTRGIQHCQIHRNRTQNGGWGEEDKQGMFFMGTSSWFARWKSSVS